MNISGKEVAVIVQALKVAHFDELAEKVIKHFNDLNERFAEAWWIKEDVKNAFETNGDGSAPTDEQVEEALQNVDEERMKEAMIEAGWDFIYKAVDEVLGE